MNKRIPLLIVDSSQINAIGHDAETNTLAIQFKSFKGGIGSTYHYANFTAEDFAAFKGADSLGRYFGAHIKPFVDKYPYTKVVEHDVEQPAATASAGPVL